MKRYWIYAMAVALVVSLPWELAQAKRMGGGGSVGKQSPNVMQRNATPPSQATPPAQQAAPAAGAAAPSAAQAARPAAGAAAAGAAQQASRSRWLAPLAGLAAGLGLAALASHLGFGEGLASFMMLMLLVIAGVFVVRLLLRSRKGAAPATRDNPLRPAFSYNGVGQEASVNGYTPGGDRAGTPPAAVVRPTGVVRDESAPSTAWRVPDEFDRDGFVQQAKQQYVALQAAYDRGDIDALRDFTTPEMLTELNREIVAREGKANVTDVVTLNAELLGISSSNLEHLASVRFHGMVREVDGGAAQPFDEVWNLSKPVDGSSGWVLAGIQSLS